MENTAPFTSLLRRTGRRCGCMLARGTSPASKRPTTKKHLRTGHSRHSLATPYCLRLQFSYSFLLGMNSVSAIRAIFWDIGGVLLSNAWDRTQRMTALEHFHLDEAEF